MSQERSGSSKGPGVAGLFIEDQVFPKRCGHMEGKQVIATEEMIAKIKAAVDARTDDDLMIMARTDALAVYGIDEAIERGNRYAEAGRTSSSSRRRHRSKT